MDSFDKKTRESISEGNAKAVPLKISSDRLKTLEQLGKVKITNPNNISREFQLESTTARGIKHQFTATPDKNGDYNISQEGEPLMVLAPVEGEKPLTADYDLMMVAPEMSNLGPQDNLMNDVIQWHAFKNQNIHLYPQDKRKELDAEIEALVNQAKKEPNIATDGFDSETSKALSYSSQRAWQPDNQPNIKLELPPHLHLYKLTTDEKYYNQQSDKDLGNVSNRLENMIPQFNKELNRAKGLEVVHHGADTANPFTDPKANYPATFFLPEKWGNFLK